MVPEVSVEAWRKRYESVPVPAVVREVVSVMPDEDDTAAPVLCVAGDDRGAAAFTQNWLNHLASRGHEAHAVSVRGQGNTPKAGGGTAGKAHDVVQAASRLSRRAILIGHGFGAMYVVHALLRYPAAAAVLVAPRGVKASVGTPAGDPPILVAGCPEDRKSNEKRLDAVAAAYGSEPLLFSGVGHDFMADAGWQAPLDAIIDWLQAEKVGLANPHTMAPLSSSP